jgi:alpha-L-rhamnosidase
MMDTLMRRFLSVIIGICFYVNSIHAQNVAKNSLAPATLTCEYLNNPIGIDTEKPRFSWTLRSDMGSTKQSAYEMVVTKIREGAEKKTVWQTGRVNSSQQLHIEYNGETLDPFTRYTWQVKVYDENNSSSGWSEPASFETAMLKQSDWKAKWISDGSKHPEKPEDYYEDDRMPLFRKEFKANTALTRARLYISGVGYYEAYLNGKKVSDHVLDPGWTTYKKQVQYVVHDITSLLQKGNNVAGIMLGNGWWNPLPFKFFGRWDLRDFQETGRPCVKAEIHLGYSDGTTQIIPTDESWLVAPGAIVKNNVYLGEHYDARLEQANWNTSGANVKAWKSATFVNGPSGKLTTQMQPPIRITRVIKPLKITELKPGIFIVDMGQNFAGVARVKVKGKAGTKITLRYGEGLFEDGSLNVMTTVATQIKKGGIKGGPGAPETAWQEDSYVLKGSGIEVWAPRFTFHGFRYVEITGWPGKPSVNDIEGLRMNSDVKQQGTFSCSNPMFNKLHDVIQWTFLSNIFSVQSDCPGREKMGYGADMVVSAKSFMYNYDMANFYRKAVSDFSNEQRPLGGMTEIAPFTGIDDRGYGDLSGPLGWQLAFPFVQKQLYEFYGDRKVIEENYPALQRQMEFLKSQAKNNLFYWDISDHEALDPKPEALSASVFYYHHAVLASEFAGILGKKEDSVTYTKLQQQIKRRIVQQFSVPGTGRFDNATQAAQIFALWYDVTPEKEQSLQVLLKELERHQWHLSTGIFTTQMFFDVMRSNNQNEIAYRVANQKTFPGWGHMLEKGATTLWESWEFPETVPSRNHPMFGSIEEWFYRSLLGINSAAPGFEKILIKPQPAGDLTWANGSYNSVRGLIVSDWKLDGNTFILKVSIPPNTTAEVWIPAKEQGAVTENGTTKKDIRYQNGYAIVQVGSGNYTFSSTR